MDKVLVTVNYYIREKFWCSIRNLCDQELQKGSDPILTYWRAFGIFKEGNVTEALREIQKVQDRREVSLASAIAMIHYHERCRNVDQEAVDTLTVDMDNREEMASDKDLYTAACFLWHISQFRRASTYLQKIIDNTGGHQNSSCIKGWIFLSAPKEELHAKSATHFDTVLEEDEQVPGKVKHIESMLGRAKLFEKTKQYDKCLQTLSEIAI